MAALLVLMLIGTVAWRSLRSDNHDAPVVTLPNPTTAPPAAPERALSYSLRVKKPGARSFAALDDVILKAGDEADFNLSSPQTGYLYVINEGPAPTRGLPNFVVLFPTPFTNNRSAAVAANQVIGIPLSFDAEVGRHGCHSFVLCFLALAQAMLQTRFSLFGRLASGFPQIGLEHRDAFPIQGESENFAGGIHFARSS